MATAQEKAAADGDKDALNRLLARRPAEKVVWLATDDDLLAGWNDAKEAERLAKGGFGRTEVDREAAAKAVADAEAALVLSGAVRLLLRNAGRTQYRALFDEHPPTEEDHKLVRQSAGRPDAMAGYHVESFRPALVALAVAEPAGLTAELVAEMAADGRLSEGELDHLVTVAHQLHAGTRVADLGK